MIPVASQSIAITAGRQQGNIATKILARPNTSVTFDNLPVGTITMAATAYPQTNGTGVSHATGATQSTLSSGQTTNFTVTMANTIDRIDLTPANPSLKVAKSVQLTASPRNSAGDLVLTVPSTLEWTSSATGVATVDSAGKVMGVTAGPLRSQFARQNPGGPPRLRLPLRALPRRRSHPARSAYISSTATQQERVRS